MRPPWFCDPENDATSLCHEPTCHQAPIAAVVPRHDNRNQNADCGSHNVADSDGSKRHSLQKQRPLHRGSGEIKNVTATTW